MRKTFKVHLRSGTTIKFKADDFKITHNAAGDITEWRAPNHDRWVMFMPGDLVAVERETMKFLYYFGRHGEEILTEHTPDAWEALKEEMQKDNRMTFEQAVEEWGEDCIDGSLSYSDNAHVSMDDGGQIKTLWLTEVDRGGLVK